MLAVTDSKRDADILAGMEFVARIVDLDTDWQGPRRFVKPVVDLNDPAADTWSLSIRIRTDEPTSA
ncbi:hypothetical protein JCM17843_31000 [Kordiimonadales bacterium JCM 17843]|nr:hypothetical protein JCM17843_31000 [Kordiimonadales bacterium JCM 17843]